MCFFRVFYSILCRCELSIMTVSYNITVIASCCGSFIFTAGVLCGLFVFSSGGGHLDSSWCCVDILVHTGSSLVREDSEE